MSAASSQAARQRWAMVAAGVLVLLVALLGPDPTPDPDAEVPPSTFLTGKGGARALYLAAEELGLDVRPWMRPVADLSGPDAPDGFVVLAPSRALTGDEARVLLEWTGGGRTLVYAPGPGTDELLAALEVELERDESASDPPAPLEVAEVDDPRLRRILAPVPMPVGGIRGRLEVDDLGEHDARPVLVDAAGRAGALLIGVDEGRVLLLADVAGLDNHRLRDSALTLFLLRALAQWAGTGTIAFDEYHHGYEAGAGIVAATWAWLIGGPVGWALLGVAVVGLAALFCAGIRLGDPIPEPPPPGRSSLEHAVALAAAYREVGARGRCRQLLLEGLRLELGQHAFEQRLAGLVAVNPALAGDAGAVTEAGTGSSPGLVELATHIDHLLAAAHGTAGQRSS